MNNRQPKFIITGDGRLRLGTVNWHCELLRPGVRCLGGGFYELDYLSHRLLLNGASSEYGEPAWEKVERVTLSAYYRGLEMVYSTWEGWKEDFPVSERIEVSYE